MDVVVPINMTAVVVAALSTLVVGSLWYGPLFGKPWIAMMPPMKGGKEGMWKLYAAQLAGSFIMAYVLAHMIVFASAYTKMYGATAGMTCAFWAWLGFVAPVLLGSVLWEQRPLKLYYINASHYLASMLLMGAIIGWMM